MSNWEESINHHQLKADGGIDGNSNPIKGVKPFDVEKVITEIEKEHRSIAIRQLDGEVKRVLLIEKDPYPVAAVECEALKQLKRLREEKGMPKIPVKKTKLGEVIEKTGYGWFVHKLGDLISCRVPHFVYPEPLNVFFEEMERLGIVKSDTFGSEYIMFALPDGGAEVASNMEGLLGSVKVVLQSDAFKKKLDVRKAQARRIRKAFLRMYRRCLEKCSRILVVRVDLEYALNGAEEGAHPLFSENTPDQFALDVFLRERDRFINNLRDKVGKGRLAENLLEWGWKAEYGEKRGWHLHCVFIFDASRVRNAWYYAMQFGEMWERLTEGRGTYYNCHKNTDRYGQCCLGENRRDDAEAAKGFEHFANYLAMDDQMPIVRTSLKSQVYGISRVGTRRKKKARAVQGENHAA